MTGASKLVARAGVMRADTSRANSTSLGTVGFYATVPGGTGSKMLWKRVLPPTTTWTKVSP